jgi:sarcosine oxidase subunit beta
MNSSTFDIAIIGGGIHGLSTAYFARQRGYTVALFEKAYMGRHASGVNAGGVRTLGRPPAEIPLSLRSSELWRSLEFLSEIEGGFRQFGQLKVAESEADLQVLKHRVNTLGKLGFNHEVLIGREAVRTLVPTINPGITGALWVATDGYATPYKIVNELGRQIKSHGVQCFERTTVHGLQQTGSSWKIDTSGTSINAKTLVIAAGAWSGRIAAMAGDTVSVKPGGLMLMVTQRLPHFIDPVLGATSRGLSFKQFANGTVVIGGSLECRSDLDTEYAEMDFKRLANSANIVMDLFPSIGRVHIVRAWSGIDGYSADKTSIVGPSPNLPNVFYACGFSASGFQLGPASGEYTAGLIDGEPPIHQGLLPARFTP